MGECGSLARLKRRLDAPVTLSRPIPARRGLLVRKTLIEAQVVATFLLSDSEDEAGQMQQVVAHVKKLSSDGMETALREVKEKRDALEWVDKDKAAAAQAQG
jgi:hypothetical protein